MSSKKRKTGVCRSRIATMYRCVIIVVVVTTTTLTMVDGLSFFSNENHNRIPQIDQWEVLKDGTLTGIVKGHPVLDDFEEMTTSPLLNPLPRTGKGDIVTTRSGCQYKLVSPKTRRKIKSLSLPSLFTQKSIPVNNVKIGRPGSIPSIDEWQIDSSTGRLTGIVTGHPNLPDGDLISTSAPIDNDLKEGMVIKTESGSRYKLESRKIILTRMGFNTFGAAAAVGVVDILGLNLIGSSDVDAKSNSKSRNNTVESKNDNKVNPSSSEFESNKLEREKRLQIKEKERITVTNSADIQSKQIVAHQKGEKVNEKMQIGHEETARCEDQQSLPVIETAEHKVNEIKNLENEAKQSLTKGDRPVDFKQKQVADLQKKEEKVNKKMQIGHKETARCENQQRLPVTENTEQNVNEIKNLENEAEHSPTKKGDLRPYIFRKPRKALVTSLENLKRRLREGKPSSNLIDESATNAAASVTASDHPFLPTTKKVGDPKPSSTKPFFARNVADKLKFVDEIDGLLSEVEYVLAEVDNHFKNESTVPPEPMSLFIGSNTADKLKFVDEIDGLSSEMEDVLAAEVDNHFKNVSTVSSEPVPLFVGSNTTDKPKFVDKIDGLLSEVGDVLVAEVDNHLKNVSTIPSEPVPPFVGTNTESTSKDFQKEESIGAAYREPQSPAESENKVRYSVNFNASKDKERQILDKKLEELLIENRAQQSPVESEKKICVTLNLEASEEEKRENLVKKNRAPQSPVESANKMRHALSHDASKERKRENLDMKLEELIENERIEQERFERKEVEISLERTRKRLLDTRLVEQKRAYHLVIKKERERKEELKLADAEAKLEKFRRTLSEKQMKDQKSAHQLALHEMELLVVKEHEDVHKIMKEKGRRQMLAYRLNIQKELAKNEQVMKKLSEEKAYKGKLEKNRRGLLADRLKQQEKMLRVEVERLGQAKLEKFRRNMVCARLIEQQTAYQLLLEERSILTEVLKNTKAEIKLERLRRAILEIQMKEQQNSYLSILQERASLQLEEHQEQMRKVQEAYEITKENERRQILTHRLHIQKEQVRSEQKKMLEVEVERLLQAKLEKARRKLLGARLSEQQNAHQLLLEERELLQVKEQEEKMKEEQMVKDILKENERREMLAYRLNIQKEQAQGEETKREIAANNIFELQLEKNRRKLLEERLKQQKFLFEVELETKNLKWKIDTESARQQMLFTRLLLQSQLAAKSKEEAVTAAKAEKNAKKRAEEEATKVKEELTSMKVVGMKGNTDQAVAVPQAESKMDDSERLIELKRLEVEFDMLPRDVDNESSPNNKQELNSIEKEQSEVSSRLENAKIIEEIYAAEEQQSEQKNEEASSLSKEQKNHNLSLDNELSATAKQEIDSIKKDQSEVSTLLENTQLVDEIYPDKEGQEQEYRDMDAANKLSLNAKQEFDTVEKEKSNASARLENAQIVEEIYGGKDEQSQQNENVSSISKEQRNCDLELDEQAAKITESDLSYKPSDKVLANLPMFMNDIAGTSIDRYDAKDGYFTGRNVAIHADSTLSIPIRISTPGTIVEFSITKSSYDFGFGITASLDRGQMVKIKEMSPFLKRSSTEKILVPTGSAPCIMQFKFQNSHSTLLEKVFLSYKIKVTPPSVNTIQLGRRRRARAALGLIESNILSQRNTLETSYVKVMELKRDVECLEKEMDTQIARIESLRAMEQQMQ